MLDMPRYTMARLPLPLRLPWLALVALLAPLAVQAADDNACPAHHRVVLTEAFIAHEPGDVVGLARAIGTRLADRLEAGDQQVVEILPPTRSRGLEPAMDTFVRHAAPYFLRIEARDLGTDGQSSAFVLLPDRYGDRAGQLRATLFDGARGARLGQWRIDLDAADGAPFSPEASARSERFWQSDWGQSLDNGIERLAGRVLETIRCRPLVGWVLSTQSHGGATDLRVDLGRRDGLRAGDQLLVISPGTPVDSLGVNLLTRPSLETAAGPVREPRSLGKARVVYLGERDSTLRYDGHHAVERGNLVQVQSQPGRLKRLD